MKADQFNKAVAVGKMVIHRLFKPWGVLMEPEGQRAICFAYILLRTTNVIVGQRLVVHMCSF